MSEQKPSVGRIVHYALSQHNAEAINRRRKDAVTHSAQHAENANGVQLHVGNHVQAGDVYPMTIVRVWGDRPDSAVNGQVHLDGNDTFWATSVSAGDGEGRWLWPTLT